jgi:hypothetical protein
MIGIWGWGLGARMGSKTGRCRQHFHYFLQFFAANLLHGLHG